ncbi:hypothetical protein C8R44DRAFT_724135 [Mycena epipterygia]|nr:hypothetical protein C8R44DRAFT_724135 [Mycena epipterygia]
MKRLTCIWLVCAEAQTISPGSAARKHEDGTVTILPRDTLRPQFGRHTTFSAPPRISPARYIHPVGTIDVHVRHGRLADQTQAMVGLLACSAGIGSGSFQRRLRVEVHHGHGIGDSRPGELFQGGSHETRVTLLRPSIWVLQMLHVPPALSPTGSRPSLAAEGFRRGRPDLHRINSDKKNVSLGNDDEKLGALACLKFLSECFGEGAIAPREIERLA